MIDLYGTGIVYCTMRQRAEAQLKMIEEHKWLASEEVGYDIGMNEATFSWIEKGYAKLFSKRYIIRLDSDNV